MLLALFFFFNLYWRLISENATLKCALDLCLVPFLYIGTSCTLITYNQDGDLFHTTGQKLTILLKLPLNESLVLFVAKLQDEYQRKGLHVQPF